MRHPVFPLFVCLGLSVATVRADAVPVVEPVEETPSAQPVDAPAAQPVVAEVNYAEPIPAARPAPAERTTPAPAPARAPAEPARAPRATESAPAAAPAPAPVREESGSSNEWGRTAVRPEKQSRQTHTAYYVNRVKFSIPSGVKITVKKDWYAKDISLEYPANPYSNWQGVTPFAFSFKHTGTTLEVHHATPKYLPATLLVRVPVSVEVGF